ncbi:hypothetical protein [Xenorhabdus anantnagensis]|uniref:Inverse autotransporter beta-barrel domain-containing protein n=1 Tax=Xenorhabdus anantnagensis TaxID=3025875 RepID=A0ABT5LTN3_9GAMM|nr:hypothetical protein [Xenorhabdus anantnagensis]MDC9597584.1 hypothetical protein [Xenorhabdus anantnagensis]
MINLDEDPKISYSIDPTKANLIIGQEIDFVVTAITKKNLETSTIKFSKGTNIKANSTNSAYFTPSPDHTGTYTAALHLTVSNTMPETDPIIFEIELDKIPDTTKKTFTCKANHINLDSMVLKLSRPYLDIPTKNVPNTPSSLKREFSAAVAIIKDKNKNILPYVPIFITLTRPSDLDNFSIYTSNTDDSSKIYPKKFGATKGFFINSDESGNIIFYIYPNRSLSEVAEFTTNILGINGSEVYAKQKLYVVNSQPDDYDNALEFPIVPSEEEGNLTATSGVSLFNVSIDSYDNNNNGDTILFFVDGNYCNQKVDIIDTKSQLGSYNITTQLPYQIFKINNPSKLSYVVIKPRGDMFPSLSLPITYKGGVPYEPESGVKRNHTPCIVHTSLGIQPNNIIQNHDAVNYAAIMKYPDTPDNGTYGLYIEILGTTDTITEPNKVLLNTHVMLTLYINSVNKNYTKSYHGVIIKQPVGSLNKISAIIKIPFDDIVSVNEYENGSAGNITFDYTFFDGDNQYGNIWSAAIETMPADGD